MLNKTILDCEPSRNRVRKLALRTLTSTVINDKRLFFPLRELSNLNVVKSYLVLEIEKK